MSVKILSQSAPDTIATLPVQNTVAYAVVWFLDDGTDTNTTFPCLTALSNEYKAASSCLQETLKRASNKDKVRLFLLPVIDWRTEQEKQSEYQSQLAGRSAEETAIWCANALASDVSEKDYPAFLVRVHRSKRIETERGHSFVHPTKKTRVQICSPHWKWNTCDFLDGIQ